MSYCNCLITLEEYHDLRKELKQQNKTVVFTNGCFDLLHSGHIQLLQQARTAGDILIVGLNSDYSVQKLKGKNRPILNEHDRATILCTLKPVDFVVLFDSPTPRHLIQSICPDILVKGDDWKADDIVGADFVRAHGGRVLRVPILSGHSTTGIIELICQRYTNSNSPGDEKKTGSEEQVSTSE